MRQQLLQTEALKKKEKRKQKKGSSTNVRPSISVCKPLISYKYVVKINTMFY